MYSRQITTLPRPHEEDPEDPDYDISESLARKCKMEMRVSHFIFHHPLETFDSLQHPTVLPPSKVFLPVVTRLTPTLTD